MYMYCHYGFRFVSGRIQFPLLDICTVVDNSGEIFNQVSACTVSYLLPLCIIIVCEEHIVFNSSS